MRLRARGDVSMSLKRRTRAACPFVLAMLFGMGGAAPSVQAQTAFPGAGSDSFPSKMNFRVTLTPAFMAGASFQIKASGPTCVVRSGPHLQGADPSGPLGDGTGCGGSAPATTDVEIILPFFPPAFNTGLGVDELHTELVDMFLTSADGYTIVAGASAVLGIGRSLGEVEARGGASGFGGPGADSFFNLFVEITGGGDLPPKT